MNRKQIIWLSAAVVTMIIAALSPWWLLSTSPTSTPSGERKVLYWTDPMVPGYRSDKPGKSPFMDMELVPVYADESGSEGTSTVSVRTDVSQNLAVRTTQVVRSVASRQLMAQGYLFRDGSSWLVIADIFGTDTAWLKPGLKAEITVAEIPGQRFAGILERTESDRDIGGRSVKARVRLLQGDHRLQPNMSASAQVSATGGKRLLLVPREALIRTGTRTVLVRVLEDGRFQPVEVVAGDEYGEQIEIRSGAQEGDKIVVSGQFLIDSESNVRESLKRMDSPANSAPATEHKH